MIILGVLKKIATKLTINSNAIFDIDVDEQKNYLHHFPEPNTCIDRSYYQYKCQMKLLGIKYIFINIFSLPLLIIWYLKKDKYATPKTGYDAVFLKLEKLQDIIPKELKEEFNNIRVQNGYADRFTQLDKRFFIDIIKKHPFEWHFLLKSLIKIRLYSGIITEYSPKAIIVCGEYSFTSSILTEYCRQLNIEHIDVMHGEKLFFIRDSFFVFERTYVWDEYYINLFKELRADASQFKVAIPPSISFKLKDAIKEHDYTYYLANEDKATLSKISDSLRCLKARGKKIAIRPHPRYSDRDVVKRIFPDFIIENDELDLALSVMRTTHAIGLYTTVLNQAFRNGIDVVIDDVSNKDGFEKLKSLKYIMINKKHRRLSEILEKNNVE